MACRHFGPADNQDYYNLWLKSDRLFDKLFMSVVNIDPFTADLTDPAIPTMNYLAWYGRSLSLNPDKPVNQPKVLVAGWADLMGPKILEDKFMTLEESRTALVESVRHLLQPNTLPMVSVATQTSFAAAHPEVQDDPWTAAVNLHGDPPEPEIAMLILKHLAINANQAFKLGGVTMIVQVYLAILKRGTMSEAFVSKIVDGLQNDLQISGVRINTQACATFYSVFGANITDVTIQDVTARWEQMLPISALRLKLTVTQAAGSGLTALSTVGRAVRIFNDFDWPRISFMYPDEWANLILAMTDVGDNIWYGFKKDLGPVASTKYKNIAYVAKELLIKVNGETSLRAYGGWTRRAKYQQVVDELIADYETAKTASMIRGEAMPEIGHSPNVETMSRLIAEGPRVYN